MRQLFRRDGPARAAAGQCAARQCGRPRRHRVPGLPLPHPLPRAARLRADRRGLPRPAGRRADPALWAAQAQAGAELAIAAPKRGARAYLPSPAASTWRACSGRAARSSAAPSAGMRGAGCGPATCCRSAARRRCCMPRASARRRPKPPCPPTGRRPAFRPASPWCACCRRGIRAVHRGGAAALLGDGLEDLRPEQPRGFRLAGPPLDFARRLEMRSHGIVPGVVQVPPSGEPIIQTADAHTAGG